MARFLKSEFSSNDPYVLLEVSQFLLKKPKQLSPFPTLSEICKAMVF